MATRAYLQNAAAPYSPASIRGTWTLTTGFTDIKGDVTKAGAAATKVITKSAATNPSYLGGLRIVLPALQEAKNIVNGVDTLQWIIGAKENANTTNAFFRIHVYATVGASDTVRATLLSTTDGATEFNTSAQGRGEGALALATAALQAGDHIVIELGARFNTNNTGVTVTYDYGNTGASDLTQGSTSVTTQTGWFEFSQSDLLGISPTSTFNPLSLGCD
jgi:hypothetical protein